MFSSVFALCGVSWFKTSSLEVTSGVKPSFFEHEDNNTPTNTKVTKLNFKIVIAEKLKVGFRRHVLFERPSLLQQYRF